MLAPANSLAARSAPTRRGALGRVDEGALPRVSLGTIEVTSCSLWFVLIPHFHSHEFPVGTLILPRGRPSSGYKHGLPFEANPVVSGFAVIHAASLAAGCVFRGTTPAAPDSCGLARREIDSLAVGPTP